MRINQCGINRAHDRSFIINRPSGSGDNLFIYTRTPVTIVQNGQACRYPAETVVFYRKGDPQHFMAAGQVYANDYIHFSASDEEMKFIDSLSIPSGVPLRELDSTVFLSIHRYLCIEHQTESTYKEASIDLLLRYFLIKLAQAFSESVTIPLSGYTRSALRDLRDQIYSSPEHNYSISSLAASVGLSASYFQVIYKKIFGRPCHEDIIFARIDKAKSLLLSTDIPISAIARSCGYENDAHFSRQFKKYTSLTPSDFKKIQLGFS